jgi:hypothetical protein
MTPPVILPTGHQGFVLDIGGEGRHAEAWNLNPSPTRTLGPDRGRPIPRWIPGRADAIPLAAGVVDWLIVERTPLSHEALVELARVVSPSGRITLRHVPLPWADRHALARSILPGRAVQRMMHLGGAVVQETEFWLGGASARP